MKLLVVESPAKAKTINKYLGSDYKVLASYGHIRDLPSKDGSVKPEEDFAMTWSMEARGQKHFKDIAEAAKGADSIILATDPDREGEAISWHVLEMLKTKKALKDIPVQRVAFNAVTKSAVLEAISHPREIDTELVDAYLARRALDYLVGFTLSPVLWRKLPGARSAGRVQSVALRLICERESEIERFKPEEYWTIDSTVTAPDGTFGARIYRLDGKKLEKNGIPDKAAADTALAKIQAADFRIGSVSQKPVKRNPAPPFITSTLQQEASRKLGFSAKRTMQIAQGLYEGVTLGGETVGLITYMRTDGVSMEPSAIANARHVIEEEYGPKYVPEKPRHFASKVKNAQEAHEAIRPTSFNRTPKQVARYLNDEQLKLYTLVWNRAMASQMPSAELLRTTIDVTSKDDQITFRATGSVVKFDGFLTLYSESRDDEEDEASNRLPMVREGEDAKVTDVKPEQHFTEPPPRYSEASLVKKLEELGIGRPSTYASILSVLRERSYVKMDRNRFIPEDKGRLVTTFLTNFFRRYVEYSFTADLEEQLDSVSEGKIAYKQVLRDFWKDFSAAVGETKDLKISDVIDALEEVMAPHIFPPNEDGSDPRVCPTCGTGHLSLKLGKFGAFVGCSNYPECRYTRQLGQTAEEAGSTEPKVLGVYPETGEEISLRSGRFGPYLQLGEEKKPKRASIPKGMNPAEIDLEYAIKLISLPREVGIHPELDKPITANFGRFGPYVACDGQYASLETPEDVFTVGINRAVTLLAEKKARGRSFRGPEPLKIIGKTKEEKEIKLMKGRYGPYVTDGDVNATIPKDKDPLTVTLEEAEALIVARAAKGPSKKKTTKKAATKKATTKKTTTKKATTKKATTKKAATKKAAAPAATEKKATTKKAVTKKATTKKAATKKAATKKTTTKKTAAKAKAAK